MQEYKVTVSTPSANKAIQGWQGIRLYRYAIQYKVEEIKKNG